MSQPTPYERQFAFSGQPKATWAEGLENELNAVKVTSDETLDNLELIQRDDGKLRNGIVTRDSLAPDLALAGLVALDFADEATAIAASASNVAMAPLGVKQQIDARLADDTTPDTDAEKLSTPLQVKQRARYGTWQQSGTGAVGRTLDEKIKESVSVEDFGVVAGLDSSLASANDAALADALAYLKSIGGGNLYARSQFYVFGSAGIRIPSGVHIWGSGTGEWEPVYPARPKTWDGTNFVFYGTGTKDQTFPGITSMKNGGGWRPDPDNPGDFFKLTSFYNADASGTTPATLRQFSAAVTGETEAQNWGLHDLRLVPWNGVDGIADYSNQASTSLGSDWDIGLAIKDGEYCVIEGVQSVGYWREFGFLHAITNGVNSRGERNKISRSRFQGRVGRGIRGPDRWFCTTPSTSSVQITWSEESYWPASGTFRGSDNVTYSYTGTTRAGGASEYLQFTGVTPNPTGIFQVRHPSAGIANTEYSDVIETGLGHTSGQTAASLGLANSKAFEASGFPLRGVKHFNYKAHTPEPVNLHLHDAQDFAYYSPQIEGGTRLLASPISNSGPWATGQVGETRNLQMYNDDGTSLLTLDLFTPRSGLVQGLQIAPSANLTGDLIHRPLSASGANKLQSFAGVDFLDAQIKTFTPGFRFVTVTSYTTQTGRYVRVGDYVYFNIYLDFTGLDTTDTSAIGITLPIVGELSYPVTGQICERVSSGINMSTLTRPYLDASLDGHLGLTHNRTSRVAYNTASIFATSGVLSIVGFYKAA